MAAGLIALVVFAACAFWLRLELGSIYASFDHAKTDGDQATSVMITAMNQATEPISPPGAIKAPRGEISLSQLDWTLWPGVFVAAVLVGLVGWGSASGALRPVEWMRWQAAEVTAGSLDRRIDVPVRRLGIGRMSIGVRAAIAAALIASGPLIGGVVWLRSEMRSWDDARIGAEMEAARQALDSLTVVISTGQPATVVPGDVGTYLYEVVYSDGRVESSTIMAEAEQRNNGPFLYRPRPGETAGSYDSYATVVMDEETFNRLRDLLPYYQGMGNVWARSVTVHGVTATIYVFERLTVGPEPTEALDSVLLPGVPGSLVLIGFVAWFSTTRSLVPVEWIRMQAADISTKALDKRVPVPSRRDSISRLAVTLNEMLDRLENSIEAQRQFVADAAHELRSPIASLRTVLEVAADHPDRADWLAVVRDAVIDTRRLQDLAEDLLLLARLDSALPLPTDRVDLSEVADSYANRVDLRADAPAFVTGDAKQLNRLLRNLVDNAERHAASRVTVTVLSTEHRVFVEVADDGPGIPVADRERVFDRFTRLDEARDSDAGGSGLGLAIAREIAVRHGGTLTVGDHAVFTASFPRA
nr:probable two-component sensor kinase [Kibdelosporangium sp. MJ126-NF4]CTQ91504.1 probable two-component sensor kinase [Kibdelosporangium sp. MJ126-NF4]